MVVSLVVVGVGSQGLLLKPTGIYWSTFCSHVLHLLHEYRQHSPNLNSCELYEGMEEQRGSVGPIEETSH